MTSSDLATSLRIIVDHIRKENYPLAEYLEPLIAELYVSATRSEKTLNISPDYEYLIAKLMLAITEK